jgi:hypothetical protein
MRFRRTAIPLIVAMLVVTSSVVQFPRVALAATPPESDIPGIVLPGPVASGQLGGPVYDVVYRLEVKPGYVIVAGLTGTAGTDFDLYLFDSSATTVLSNQGLLAKSTGPASSENLSYPSFAGGTYYIDLNGASDVEGTYTLTVQLVADQAAPIASLLLADGRPSVNTTTVTVRLTAFASLSGIAQMAFSSDGVSFGAWQTYTVQTSWTFPPGDGVKTLWAKVRSGVGVDSAPTSGSVVLDTQPPLPTSINPAPGSFVTSLRPVFTVKFNEPMDPASWTLLGLIVQAASGARVDGTFTYDAASRTGTFLPTADLTPGSPYVVTIGQVRDVAGNTMQPLSSWTVTPFLPTSVTIAAAPQIVLPGSGIVVTGTASGLDGADVILEAREGSSTGAIGIGPYIPLAGRLSVGLVPAMNTWYRWRYLGTPTTAPAASSEVRVLVRRSVALRGVAPTTTRTVRAGARVTLTAQVGPSGPGARLSFRLYRYDGAKHAYVYYRSYGRMTDLNGRATLTWTPSAGRFYWRVTTLSSPEFANSISPVYRWTVLGG